MAESTVVLITGVNSGIGLEMAKICLNRPDHTVIGSVRTESSPGIDELKSIGSSTGSKLLLVHIESTSDEDPKRAAAEVEANGIHHVDIVIANAGGSPLPILPLEEVPMADMVRDFQTNAASHLVLFQAFRHLLQRSKNPKWAAITSAAGSISLVEKFNSFILPAYSTSKAAQNYLSQALAFSQKEWLTVIDIHPGHVQSGPGNWLAKRIGLDEAPLTTVESASAVLKTIDGAVREEVLGKLIRAIDGTAVPW